MAKKGKRYAKWVEQMWSSDKPNPNQAKNWKPAKAKEGEYNQDFDEAKFLRDNSNPPMNLEYAGKTRKQKDSK
jgi:hypothetical protein